MYTISGHKKLINVVLAVSVCSSVCVGGGGSGWVVPEPNVFRGNAWGPDMMKVVANYQFLLLPLMLIQEGTLAPTAYSAPLALSQTTSSSKKLNRTLHTNLNDALRQHALGLN